MNPDGGDLRRTEPPRSRGGPAAPAAACALSMFVGLFAAGCSPRAGRPDASAARAADSAAVTAGLARYERLTLDMDHAGIAGLFSPEGEIANPGTTPIHGREAIRRFLEGFSDYHVIENRLVADSLRLAGDLVFQSGTYDQRVRVPKGDTLQVRGRFDATWVRTDSSGWRILRMGTHAP